MAPKSKKKETATTAPQAREQPPNWPAFRPLAPISSLSLEEVLPNQIITIRNFWSSALCKTYVSFLSSLPLVTTPGKPKKGEAVRVNDRFQIQDAAFAKRLWEAMKDVVMGIVQSEDGLQLDEQARKELWGGDVVGLNPNIRIYRYGKGQFFDKHYDDSNNIIIPSSNGSDNIQARTTWTLLLYLTAPATGCIGGETVFYPDPLTKKSLPPEPIAVGLEVGMALFHRHGPECMLHEGKEVLAGEKWVIRSDLCVSR